MRYIDDEVITVSSTTTPVGLTRSKIDRVGTTRANSALVVVKGGPVMYSFVTNPPTADASIPAVDGDQIQINGYENLENVLFLRPSSGTTKLYVSYGI